MDKNMMERIVVEKEIAAKTKSGLAVLLLNTLLLLVGVAAFVLGIVATTYPGMLALAIALSVAGGFVGFIVAPVLYGGLKVVRPGEALVLTLFGKYVGTIREAGFYYVNPFCTSVAPPSGSALSAMMMEAMQGGNAKTGAEGTARAAQPRRKISLKTMTLNNDKQKINDRLGNPIIIGIVVVWRVANTAKAAFNVDNYVEFLSIQCDSALRNIVRLYPYDAADDENAGEKSLRGSSQEIAANLRDEIQKKVEVAGLEVMEARITHLAYAPEIAAAMLQRQQAAAIVDARQLIVEGAVGMVEMALDKLSERAVVELDEERKAAMVSNLLVVLCGNRDAQPVVNSGSLY